MPVISKELQNALCSEFVHPWCDGCFETFLETWKTGFKESVKIYGTLYFLSSIVTRKKFKYFTQKIPLDILRSSTFLSLNAALFSAFICTLRWLIKFNIVSIAWVPAFLASAASVSIERNSRRQQLTVYMMNIAMQTIFIMLKKRNIVRSYKNGEVLLFSIAISGLMFLFVENRAPAYIMKFFGFLFGHKEISKNYTEMVAAGDITCDIEDKPVKSKFSMYLKNLFSYLHKRLHMSYKTILCHHDVPCLQYVVDGFRKPFVVGIMMQYAIVVLKNSRRIFRSPFNLLFYLLKRSTYNLGLFLGLFSLIFRLCQCSQKRFAKWNKRYFVLISGFIAGFANKLYPSVAISMYSLSKLAELCCRSYLSRVDLLTEYNSIIMIILYSMATATVFHTAMLEPNNVPKTYLSFLNRMTNGRINKVDLSYL